MLLLAEYQTHCVSPLAHVAKFIWRSLGTCGVVSLLALVFQAWNFFFPIV
jgi:hypothetical protein